MICNKYYTASNTRVSHLKRTAFSILILGLSACSQLSHDTTKTKQPIEILKTAKVEHIVLVSIDGLRPDAITEKNAPNLFKLTQSGLYYPQAQTIQRSVTLPSHTSMLTGLDSSRHNVDKNKSLPGFISHPTVMKLVHQNGQSTAALFAKKKLNFLFSSDTVDYVYGRGLNNIDFHQTYASNLATEFTRTWGKNAYNLTFIHIREPDSAGHKHGWMSDEYLNQAVTAADQAVGQIYTSITNSRFANSTMLIITADHGGKDKIHWNNNPEDLTIPWLAVHPDIKPDTRIAEQVRIYDTAPTILYLLRTPIPSELDGRIIPGIQSLFPRREDKSVH